MLVLGRYARPLSIRAKGRVGDPGPFESAYTFALRIREQRMIEIGSFDLVTVSVFSIKPEREIECDALSSLIRDKLGAGFQHALAGYLFPHTEPVQDRKVSRKQRFTYVKARMRVLLQQDDISTAIRDQRCCGRARRAAANDKHVTLVYLARIQIGMRRNFVVL